MSAAGCDASPEAADQRGARGSRVGPRGRGVMEDSSTGPRLGAAAEAAEARAQPGYTLRPFAAFSGAAGPDEGGSDWSFIDCEMMEEVDLQDLPSATIACHLDPRVFVDGLCRVRAGRGGPSGGGRTLVAGTRRRRGPGPARGSLFKPGRRRKNAAMSPATLPRSPSVPAGLGAPSPRSRVP